MTTSWSLEDLKPFRDLAAERLGLELEGTRVQDLRRALQRTCEATGARQPGDLLALLTGAGAEGGQAVEDFLAQLLVNETHFFRHRGQFDVIEQRVLPEIVGRRRGHLRIWSVGCSSGEEAYSLAISVDRVLPVRARYDVSILGTDVDGRALAKARLARYRPWSFREISPDALEGWIIPGEEGYEVAPRIRELVRFSRHNLATDDFALGAGSDLVVFRNVLMYLDPPTRKRVAHRLFETLKPGGWLVVGATDPDPRLFGEFEVEMSPAGILYRKPGSAERTEHPPVIHASPATEWCLPPANSTLQQVGRPVVDAAGEACGKARAEADRGRTDAAERWLDVALSADPMRAEAHYLRGLLLQDRGDVSGALAALRQAIFAKPDMVQARFALGMVMSRWDLPRATHMLLGIIRDLAPLPPEQPLGPDGQTAGELRHLAQAQLESMQKGRVS